MIRHQGYMYRHLKWCALLPCVLSSKAGDEEWLPLYMQGCFFEVKNLFLHADFSFTDEKKEMQKRALFSNTFLFSSRTPVLSATIQSNGFLQTMLVNLDPI